MVSGVIGIRGLNVLWNVELELEVELEGVIHQNQVEVAKIVRENWKKMKIAIFTRV